MGRTKLIDLQLGNGDGNTLKVRRRYLINRKYDIEIMKIFVVSTYLFINIILFI